MLALQNATKTPEGVVVNGFVVAPAIDKCTGCDRLREFEGENFCSSYPNPTSKGDASLLLIDQANDPVILQDLILTGAKTIDTTATGNQAEENTQIPTSYASGDYIIYSSDFWGYGA